MCLVVRELLNEDESGGDEGDPLGFVVVGGWEAQKGKGGQGGFIEDDWSKGSSHIESI